MAASSSARGQCADVLRDCYATCGQSITPQQQQQQALDDLCRQLRCADGGPGGWIGKAGTLGREVLVAIQPSSHEELPYEHRQMSKWCVELTKSRSVV